MAVDLAYRSMGSGPDLLVLHGLFGSATNWSSIGKRLAADFRVHLVDLRNHGESPQAPGMSYPEMASDLRRLLDVLDLDAALMLGHSMGGKAAMTLALESPRRVRALAVIDIAPVAYDHEFEDVLRALRGVDLRALRARADADRMLAASLPDASMRSFLLQNLRREGEVWGWRVNLEAIGAGMARIVGFPDLPGEPRYDGPTLFLRGGRSDYVSEAHRGAMTLRFPTARVETIEAAGHWVQADAPAEFLRVARQFLIEAY